MSIKPSLWQAGNDLATAEYLMGNLRSLFAAIKKTGDAESAGLARIGQGIAEEWEDTFAELSDKFFREHEAELARKGGDR